VTDKSLMGLLEGTGADALGLSDVAVSGVAYRSDKVRPGDVFFCVRGFRHDGHSFAADAAGRGAAALVVERPVAGIDAPQFLVADARGALAVASARFEDEPSRSLELVGITGTNGKTTTVYLLDAILRAAGHISGVIGTVETRIADERLEAGRTTPESSDLQALLARMRDASVTAVAMEVSSHAIDLHRVDAVRFAAVAFTNLTQDHLDYHRTIEEYSAVKRRLFTDFEVGARVINVDDPYGALLATEVPNVLTVGRHAGASIRAESEELCATGAAFTLVTPQGTARVALPLAGAYNVSNALVAAGCALAIGIPLATVVAGLDAAPQVPGRLERIEAGQPFSVIVDYAHTPDSLEKAILAVKDVTEGRVIAVFGCGGDRDPEKRPLMGAAAAQYADAAVITSDNPRSEDPVGIILQVEDGARGTSLAYEVEVDRRRAIARAFEIAETGDSVLIAGKGHEDYQIFADRTIHFDDREVAREELAALKSRAQSVPALGAGRRGVMPG
jgi:UDP-N-acetylmuramoyl-L-alanyl-D-glutamate--2,6-diaminopimelate ligase